VEVATGVTSAPGTDQTGIDVFSEKLSGPDSGNSQDSSKLPKNKTRVKPNKALFTVAGFLYRSGKTATVATK